MPQSIPTGRLTCSRSERWRVRQVPAFATLCFSEGTEQPLKRFVWLLGLLAVTACQDGSPTAVTNPPSHNIGNASSPTGPQFIVVLQPKTDPRKVAKDHGLTPTYTYTTVLSGFTGIVSDAAKAGLLKDSRVVSVRKDKELYAEGLQPAASWGIDRIDDRKRTDGFYSYSATGKGVTVYIMDTGIRYSHHDFGGRASFGFDAYGGDGSDCLGHGTHVAGTVGGAVFGVAKDANLVSVRVLDCQGSGTTSSVLAGLDWIVANGHRPAVVNMSMSGDPDDLLDNAIRRLYAAGFSVVVAAGNSGTDACQFSPARVPEAITVAASTWNDSRPMYSNYGDCVDWFAPGSMIVSDAITSDTSTTTMSGTSMAAPHTAGAAALYLERSPTASAQEVASALASWTTKRIIGLSNSAHNDLLYTLGDAQPSSGNTAPTASFSASCSDLSCAFSDGSADPDGTVSSWKWDFGDGSVSAERNPTHAYAAGGSYPVMLVVTDDKGASGSASQTVTVPTGSFSNAPPAANFTFSCTRLSCSFLNASTDSDGSVVRLEWNFGDGQPAVIAAAASQSHSFDSGDNYPVTLTVTDDKGASQTLTQSVPAGVVLTLTGYRLKGHRAIDVTWAGAESAMVDIYLGSTKVTTVTAQTGRYTYSTGDRGQGTYSFRVCESGTSYCSRTKSIAF